MNQTLDQISNFKGQKGQETQVKQNIQERLERKEGQQAMLMLNLYFESKKSEEIKVERFIGWSAIEPKPPRQQLTKTMSYTIKVIAEKYISQESESRKKKNHVFSSSPPSPPGLLLPRGWPPIALPPLGPNGLSSFSGRLVVGGTSIDVDYWPLLLCWALGGLWGFWLLSHFGAQRRRWAQDKRQSPNWR